MLKSAKPKQIFFMPGEHDTSIDDGKQYLERYGKGELGQVNLYRRNAINQVESERFEYSRTTSH